MQQVKLSRREAHVSSPIYKFQVETITGEPATLTPYAGKVLLIVNTASKCVFTSQYAGLETLQKGYAGCGFSVLGFPCNQFGDQEPGTAKDIQEFCTLSYNIQFPLFSKVDVNGPTAHPLFRFLAQARRGILGTSKIKWNFTKFLVNREGVVVERYAPRTSPASIAPAIERLLAR